ncbi:Hsp70-like protein [Phytophthora palmivora]|uniref:Hsp70-like protein n=1 Tax=Phytophthora palmivora TaxID=4796 RepID=A0A2P4XUF2_9STRA|nr:Hsp70-like protein [Phytophthora palmivora]
MTKKLIEGQFLQSGDDENYDVDDDVMNVFVADVDGEEEKSESDAKQVDQGTNGVECAEYIELSDVDAASEGLSSADLRVHTRKGWDDIYSNGKLILYVTGHRFQLPAALVGEHPAVLNDTEESVGLNLEGMFFVILPMELWILIAE